MKCMTREGRGVSALCRHPGLHSACLIISIFVISQCSEAAEGSTTMSLVQG